MSTLLGVINQVLVNLDCDSSAEFLKRDRRSNSFKSANVVLNCGAVTVEHDTLRLADNTASKCQNKTGAKIVSSMISKHTNYEQILSTCI